MLTQALQTTITPVGRCIRSESLRAVQIGLDDAGYTRTSNGYRHRENGTVTGLFFNKGQWGALLD